MKKLVFLFTIALTFGTQLLAGSVYELNVKKGDKFTMTSTVTQKITQNVMGMEMVIDMDVDVILGLEVSELNKEDILFSQTYQSLKVGMSSPMQGLDVTMDSDGESNDLNKPLKSIIGKMVLVRVSKSGEVISVEGLEDLMKDLQTAQASGADIMQFFDEESIKKNFKTLFPIEYGKSYKVGDSWDLDNEDVSDMKMSMKNKYTTTEVSKKKFGFDVMSNMSMTGEQEEQGMKMEIDMSGDFKGKGEMNTSTGLIQSYEQTGEMKGITTIAANEQMPMGMEIPMSIQMTTVTTVK